METKGPWRDTIKRLLETPPAMGVEIVKAPIEHIVRETDAYVRSQIAVFCDPDTLEQTARKNAELMAILRVTNDKLERGELVEVVCCRNCKYAREDILLTDVFCCDVCKDVNYGNHYCSYGERREE